MLRDHEVCAFVVRLHHPGVAWVADNDGDVGQRAALCDSGGVVPHGTEGDIAGQGEVGIHLRLDVGQVFNAS